MHAIPHPGRRSAVKGAVRAQLEAAVRSTSPLTEGAAAGGTVRACVGHTMGTPAPLAAALPFRDAPGMKSASDRCQARLPDNAFGATRPGSGQLGYGEMPTRNCKPDAITMAVA